MELDGTQNTGNCADPKLWEWDEKERREFVISELGILREFRRLGYRPTLIPTEEDLKSDDYDLPVDTKSEERKKIHAIKRVERWMRDPKKMMRHMPDILNLSTEKIEEIERSESDEWYKANYARWRGQCA